MANVKKYQISLSTIIKQMNNFVYLLYVCYRWLPFVSDNNFFECIQSDFVYSIVKMGQKSDLTKTEKARIFSMLANEVSTLQIAKQLNRCHRIIKKFIKNSQHTRSRLDKGKVRWITKKQLTLLKKSLAQNQLATSRTLFNEANIPVPCRTTSC